MRVITQELATQLGLTESQTIVINNIFAFVKFKTISELQEAADPFDGYFPIDKGGGELEKIKASVFYQIIGNVAKPISPSDPAPTVAGWYKPQVSSELDKPSDPNSTADWGAKYSNAGNLRAKSGYDTLFYFNGTSVWKKTESKIPGNLPKKVFDQLNDNDSSTMKSAADRWDKTLTVLNSFTTVTKKEEVEITMPLSGEIDGAFLTTTGQFASVYAANGIIQMSDLANYDNIIIRGNTSSNGAGCVYLAKINAAGTRENIKIGGNDAEFIHVIDKTAQRYLYSRYKGSTETPLTTKFYKSRTVPDIKVDSVKDYIDVPRNVLDAFIHPTETIWEEIVMPYSGEIDGQFLNTSFNVVNSANAARGSIPNSEFSTGEWTKFKVVGNFNLLGAGALWLYRYRTTGGNLALLSGNAGSDKEFEFDLNSNYAGFGYSRYKGQMKFYKGKTVSKVPAINAVKDYIDAKSSSAAHRMIDAFTDYNVKPTNTAAVNTVNLNTAITAAYSTKRPLYLPSGIIKINGPVQYKPGVVIKGAGADNTTIFQESGTTMFESLDPTNSQDFNLGGVISDMTLDGNNVSDYGMMFKNHYMLKLLNLSFYRFKVNSAHLTGCIAHSVEWTQVVNAGFKILTSDASSHGYMQANLCQYNFVYFAAIPSLAMDIDRASNIAFRSCNFESCGTTGDANTGGVRATRLSPGGSLSGPGEGIDLTFENCWSESLKGPLLQLSNSKGATVIRDTMCGNTGNTTANIIVNNGCKVLITGSTNVLGQSGSTGVRTQNNGETRVDGFVRINSHVEETGGTYKTVVYS